MGFLHGVILNHQGHCCRFGRTHCIPPIITTWTKLVAACDGECLNTGLVVPRAIRWLVDVDD
jgi:hypothetical protein